MRSSYQRSRKASKQRNLISARKRIATRTKHKVSRDKLVSSSKALFFAIGLAIGIFIDALSIPKRIVEFKNNLEETSEFLNGFAYRSVNWIGLFDTFPEGVVDMANYDIASQVDAALEVEVVDGNLIDGRIWWNGSCELGMPYTGLLIEGRIKLGGKTAEIQVYDFVSGKRVNFFSGQLSNDGFILNLQEFPENLGLNGSRIAKNPEPATLESWTELYCPEFLQGFDKKMQ